MISNQNTDKFISYLDYSSKLFFDKEVVNMKSFVNKTEQLATVILNSDKLTGKSDEYKRNYVNKFKGDMLEIFAELFWSVFQASPTVGIIDYKPVSEAEDYGVDGIGTNAAGTKCAIQIKYRANPVGEESKISLEDIAKTYCNGRRQHQLDLDKDNSIIVFTSGTDITEPCKVVFGKTIHLINRNHIDFNISTNKTFWSSIRKEIVSVLTERGFTCS